MRAALGDVRQVVVDVFRGDTGTSLVSYFCSSDETRTSSGDVDLGAKSVFLPLTPDMKSQMTAAVGQLSVALPRYMVPTVFIPCRFMPSITSTKLDRGGLRRMTTSLGWGALAGYSLVDSEKRAPATPMEVRLQSIWAAILNIPVETIGRDDSFLRIGGDSITAIQLATTTREEDIMLTVKDIFDDPRLSAVAAKAVEARGGQTYRTEPFSMLPSDSVDDIKLSVQDDCALSSGQSIEDAYPCTSLQEGLMALAVKQPGSYVAKYVYRLPTDVDAARFRTAWARTVELCGNLRTRIVLQDGASIQALIREDATWEPTEGVDLRSVMDAAKTVEMHYGSRLCRYAFVEEQSGERYFVLIIHHAVFDGWSLNVVLDTLYRTYRGSDVPALQPYSSFINYTTGLDHSAASDYWKAQLHGAQRATFPRAKPTIGFKDVSRIIRTRFPFPRSMDSSITKATILRAAWAMVLARYCDTDDVCFGTTVSGRHAPVQGVDRMAGPAVATVPVRVRLDCRKPVASFLQDVQTQASEMVTYEQFGLQNIAKLGPDAKDACDFSSLIVIQPVQHAVSAGDTSDAILLSADTEAYGMEEAVKGYFSYPLVIQCHVFDKRVDLVIIYNSLALTESTLRGVSHQFIHVTQQLLKKRGKPASKSSTRGQR